MCLESFLSRLCGAPIVQEVAEDAGRMVGRRLESDSQRLMRGDRGGAVQGGGSTLGCALQAGLVDEREMECEEKRGLRYDSSFPTEPPGEWW